MSFTFKEKFKLGTLTQEDIENMVYICEDLEHAQSGEYISELLDQECYILQNKAEFNSDLDILLGQLKTAKENPLSIGSDELTEMLYLAQDIKKSLDFNMQELRELVVNVGNRLIEIGL